eukprot:Skav211974  [mRNA]  locus=scaffold1330:53967:58294:+ [translate_table: standard]
MMHLATLLAFMRLAAAFPVVELMDTAKSLQLSLPDGQKFRLDPFWLRERCLSHSSVDSITLQPLWNPHELPLVSWRDSMAVFSPHSWKGKPAVWGCGKGQDPSVLMT